MFISICVCLQEVYGAASAAAEAQGVDPAVVRDRGLDALLDKTTLLSPEVLLRRGEQQLNSFVSQDPRRYPIIIFFSELASADDASCMCASVTILLSPEVLLPRGEL
jgi:hypothetical protein